MPRKRSDNPAAIFQATLRAALEHLGNAAWLAEHSPLAAAYYLGDRAVDGPPAARGRALVTLLHEAMDLLWAGALPPTTTALVNAVEESRREQGNAGDEYAYLLLELRYFRRHFSRKEYPVHAGDMPIFMNVSTSRFFVHLDRAIDRLGEVILRLVQPALRPERPPAVGVLHGREREIASLREELATRRSLTISGAGGVGKTTLAAAIVVDRPPGTVFWYTFLPNFNDNLPGLLFAVGYFLHAFGRSALWLQLVADRERILNIEQALGLLRADLAASPAAPLFCFDEVDLLHTSDGDARSASHAQVLAFLEALCRSTPVLFVGQRGYIDTPVHVALEPFDADATAAMLAAADVSLSGRQIQRVTEATSGLPRLVELVIALIHEGDDLDELARLPLRADARPLFNRLWRRLDRAERELLVALAVFRGPAPGDAWPNHAAACRSLQARRLCRPSATGELTLLPFYRRLILEEMRPEQRENAHAQAGALRTARGEFTAAAFHYAGAGDPETAVAVWFPNRDLEIERGQAGAALEVFGGLSAKRLPRPTAARLKLIQNQLYLLVGQSQRVIDNMAGFEWQMDDIMAAEAYFQMGDAYRGQANDGFALDAYERAASAVMNHVSLVANSITYRSRILLTQGDLSAAYNEARRAHLFAEFLDGYLAMASGNFDEAQAHFEAALKRNGEGRGNERSLMEIHRRLGYIAGSRGDIAAAEQHYGVAIDYYKRIGDTLNLEGARADLSGVYLNMRQFDRFIPAAEHALSFFEGIHFEPRISQLTAHLAEAYLETGRLDEAAAYANRVLVMEEPRLRPYALYTLGLVHQRQGRPEYAASAYSDGIRTAQHNGDRFIEAYLHRLFGRLHIEEGDWQSGQVEMDTALSMFADMGIEFEVESTRNELRQSPLPGDIPPA